MARRIAPAPWRVTPAVTSRSTGASVRDLSHRYGRQVALQGVALDLPARSFVALIGPDGVGKSTLLGILAGAKQIQHGAVEVLGGDMRDARHRRSVCARIAYMPQGLGRNLCPDLSVQENITFFARLFGQPGHEREPRIRALMQGTGLAPFAHRAAKQLSGGMRQKLGLCCALVHEPDLLILDEPTTGVDPLSRRQFWELIGHMRAQRPDMTVIVATAYMEEADRFECVVAMNAGVVLATGTPEEIKTRTGCVSLEEAFIALLPADLRIGHRTLRIPPRHATQEPPAIVARELTRRFGDFTAVDRASFTIARGEIFGFLGSNGCGKTTTMKMLTGLLPATSGAATLFGRTVDAANRDLRRRVGYMSQSFSLYTELTVMQNLVLHARLYHLPPDQARERIANLIRQFGLGGHVDTEAAALPLGIRQRLSLAVAIVHAPDLLILDEPTSGVDPLARDAFWHLLIDLSRGQGVTIFVSTHFMNEAERCDRVAMMNAGRVLSSGTPAELIADRGVGTLEEAFISYLRQAEEPAIPAALPIGKTARTERTAAFSLGRMSAYAIRESLELWRDRVRLGFAVLGMAFLMLTFGFGITTDVDHIAFAVLDSDRTPESRAYLTEFTGSNYFTERPAITDAGQLAHRMASGELQLAIDIPAGFGRDLRRGASPEVGAWIDGAMPFHAESVRGYVDGVHARFLADLAASRPGGQAEPAASIETRFRYNQDFDSVKAMVPGTMSMLLALIPAILMALAVVREKELGSITNLYVTPVRRIEFILGKQLPYVALAALDFAMLAAMAVCIFGVPLKGSLAALGAGALIYVTATTSYGLLVSSFARTQIAALVGTAILTVLPATQFSGMLTPVSTLSGFPYVIGCLFPMSYFLPVSLGTFTKALGFAELGRTLLQLALFVPALTILSLCLLRKQER
jgi:ribosome-dependent ATPase